MEQNKPRIRLFGVLLKATVLFVLFNFAFIFIDDAPFGKLSLYNVLFPGRERFPFGEAPQAYNLSVFDLDAMFASHILMGTEKAADEYRVILIGDSSVWGTLLTPEETLAGQLNSSAIPGCGGTVRVYNLGYPYISLTKELLILDRALGYQPDMIIWLTTLESLPNGKQYESPIVDNNRAAVRELIAKYNLSLDANAPALAEPSYWDQTFVGRRRALADLLRLQIYGALWSGTGIDQYYPENYEPAQTDFEPDAKFHGLKPSDSLRGTLAFGVLDAGMSTQVPTILVNEPILISSGRNSEIRYNFFYPRWAYDEYRSLLAEHATAQDWHYLDLWDLVPATEFTNSGVHLTPAGERLLSDKVAEAIQATCK